MKILRTRGTKQGAFDFSKAFLQEFSGYSQKSPYEPRNKHGVSEMTIQSSIIDYLLLEQTKGNLFVQRVNNIPVFDKDHYRALPKGTQRGFPDIFVLKQGRAIFFEVKSGIGSQSTDQIKMQALLEQQGAEYYIVRSVDYVKKALAQSPLLPSVANPPLPF